MEETLTEEEIERQAVERLCQLPYMKDVVRDFAQSLKLDPPSKKELKRRKKEARRQKRARA